MDDRNQRLEAAGIPPSPPVEEQRRRQKRLRELLAAHKLDGLVIYGSGPTNPDPVRYLSGYVHPFPRAWSILVVPADGPIVLLIDREWHQPAAQEMTWSNSVRLMPTPTPGRGRELANAVSETLEHCGLHDGSVGLLGTDVAGVVEAAVAGSTAAVDAEAGATIWDALVATPSEYDSKN